MKRNLIAVLLSLALAVTGVPFISGSVMTVHAEEVVTELTNDKIALKEPSLVNTWNEYWELTVGQYVAGTTYVVDGNGNTLEYEKEWVFCPDNELADAGLQVQFYSECKKAEKALVDPNRGDLDPDEAIPVEAFGKYIYRWVGVSRLDESGNPTSDIALKLLRSKYTVTDWGDTDYQTFSLNDDGKSVTVFTIYNAENSFGASFQKKVTIGGKKYKVTAIGDNALDNTYGTGMTSVTIHSGIKYIGENAFNGAKKLKTITIQGNINKIGKNAFKGINKKAVFKIKASASNYKKIVNLIKKSGVAKTVTFKRI